MLSRPPQFMGSVLAILSCVLFVQASRAQGTQGIETFHEFETGTSTVYIGGPNDPLNPFPIPIDLDPFGPPWIKHIQGNSLVGTPPIIQIHETIINIGTEPWLDWHERAVPPANGLVPPIWTGVQMMVDGQVIGFNAVGLQTPNLHLDQFSTPVHPGSTLEIWKELDVGPDFFLLNPELVLEQYPTPEPATLALMGLGGLVTLRRRH